MKNGLIIEKVSINEGNCGSLQYVNRPIYNGKKDVRNIGQKLQILLFHCTPVKLDVITNMGSWTHSS